MKNKMIFFTNPTIVLLVVSFFVCLIPQLSYSQNETGIVGTVQSLENKDPQEIQKIKKMLEEARKNVGVVVKTTLIGKLTQLNGALVDATNQIIKANQRFEDKLTKEAGKQLLTEVSNIYGNLLASFEAIPTDFLEHASDIVENTTVKITKLTSKAIARHKGNFDYRNKLIRSKVATINKLIEKGLTTTEDKLRYKKEARLIKRLDKMIKMGDKTIKRFSRVRAKFKQVAGRYKQKIREAENSIHILNQTREDIKAQKELFDSAIVLSNLEELATEGFENEIDTLVENVGNFADGTLVLDNVFDVVFDSVPDGRQNSDVEISIDTDDDELQDIMKNYQ
jgi:predicted Zn-dependent protease